MPNLTLSLDTVAALRAVQALGQAASELKGLYEAIGEGVVDSTIDRFGSSTAPDGSKWLPNDPKTIAAYLRKFGGGVSKKTGKLTKAGRNRAGAKKPLIGYSKDLSTKFFSVVDDNGVTVSPSSTTNDYAATQQFGRGKIPARPYLGLSSDDEKSITELALEHLRQALDK